MSDTVAETISWPVMKKHLLMLEAQNRDKMDVAEGVEVSRLQGEMRILKKLRNLPETLALLDAEDRRAADEKER